MRLALLSPIHGQSIDHIARQLENYRTFRRRSSYGIFYIFTRKQRITSTRTP